MAPQWISGEKCRDSGTEWIHMNAESIHHVWWGHGLLGGCVMTLIGRFLSFQLVHDTKP